MINARNLLTVMVLGAIVSLLVRQLTLFGLAVTSWSFAGPHVGQALVTGALVGAISLLVTPAPKRR